MQTIPGAKIKLQELLHDIIESVPSPDCVITRITLDSRVVTPGTLFLACPGTVMDGRDFIGDAIQRGAAAVLCADALPMQQQCSNKVPIIVVPKLKEKLNLLAARFYGYPAHALTLLGVTGTNGKTSVTHFLASLLTKLKIPCGIIGTNGVGLPGKLLPLLNTTPDPITLQHLLFTLKQEGALAVAMEVSSHSLIQERIRGLKFKLAIFTNLTHDHLDYHGSMEEYGRAKKLLFKQPGLQYAIVNLDDSFGQELVREFRDTLTIYGYTTSNNSVTVPVVRAQANKLSAKGITAQLDTPWGAGVLQSQLLGRFNLSNLLAVVTVLGVMGVELPALLAEVATLKTVTGRMQTFGGGKAPLIVVDYAHTPDALEQALLVLQEFCQGSLWCVFGCGGDRDRSKRALMGQIAERYSDHLVITNDNPRTEDPHQIITDIVAALLCPWAVEVEQDRSVAIAHAIDCAQPNDIVLIAGKGHENYQIIGKDKVPFSDQEVVTKILATKLGTNRGH